MANTSGGIVTRVYKSGSIIYFEGDKSEHIYILKSGRVILTSIKLDTGEEVKEDVRTGEFFGVKSSLGKYPREETAQTIGETVVLVFSLADFERLVLRNVNVVRKMLRVFSNQLRRIHKMLRSVMGDGDNVNPAVELFKIGEYYYKEGELKRAQYTYKKYLEYYPNAKYVQVAQKRLASIQAGTASPDDVEFAPIVAPEEEAADQGPVMDDNFSFDDTPAAAGGGDDMFDFDGDDTADPFDDAPASTGARSELSSEMDDFLDGNDADDFDFSFDDDEGKNADSGSPLDKAISLYESGSFSEAYEAYQEVLEEVSINGDSPGVGDRATFESGMCLAKTGKKKEAIEVFAAVIKKFPNSPYVKQAVFQIGTIFEGANQMEKAKSYYRKVAAMSPRDGLTQAANDKINQL